MVEREGVRVYAELHLNSLRGEGLCSITFEFTEGLGFMLNYI